MRRSMISKELLQKVVVVLVEVRLDMAQFIGFTFKVAELFRVRP